MTDGLELHARCDVRVDQRLRLCEGRRPEIPAEHILWACVRRVHLGYMGQDIFMPEYVGRLVEVANEVPLQPAMVHDFTFANVVTETYIDGLVMRGLQTFHDMVLHGRAMKKRYFPGENRSLEYRVRYGPLHAPPLLEPNSCRDILMTVTDVRMREMRAEACQRAVLALMKCLWQRPATPRDVDTLLARSLWTTRRQEEWDPGERRE